MSQLNVDVITGRDGQAAPEFTKGLVVTGVITATTLNQNMSGDFEVGRNFKATGIATATGGFVGNVTGDVTGNASGTAGGLTGTPNITVGSVTGTTGTFSSNVSVGGTLTYEDVTNIDSVGIVTAREGILVGAGKSVGIGTDMPRVPLEVHNTEATGTFINVKSKSNTLAGINFGDYEDDDIGSVRYGNGDNSLRLFANAGEKFRVGSAGQFGIGGATYGSSGQVLTSGGGSAAPTWADASSGTVVGWKYMTSTNGYTRANNSAWFEMPAYDLTYTPASADNFLLCTMTIALQNRYGSSGGSNASLAPKLSTDGDSSWNWVWEGFIVRNHSSLPSSSYISATHSNTFVVDCANTNAHHFRWWGVTNTYGNTEAWFGRDVDGPSDDGKTNFQILELGPVQT